MNITFVFFITIGLLIIILSMFELNAFPIQNTIQKEGYVNINGNEWDVQGLWETLNKLNGQGVDYKVDWREYENHISMLVNQFSTLTTIGKTVSNDYHPPGQGSCWSDNGWRFLGDRGPNARWSNRYNNHQECKQYAQRKGKNTFGLQYGVECWVGNTDDNMVSTEGNNRNRAPVPYSNKNQCWRGGWWFDRETGGPWSQMIFKKSTKTLQTIVNYEELIKKFVASGYHNDAEVAQANNLNNTFTTLEGYTNEDGTVVPDSDYGVPDNHNFVTNDSKIKITNNRGNEQAILTNRIIDIIVRNEYLVDKEDLKDFVYGFTSKGKSLADVDSYIKLNMGFGIRFDDVAKTILKKLEELSSPSNQYEDRAQLFANLRNVGIRHANEIFNANRNMDGWFLQTVSMYGLANFRIQLLPSSVQNIQPESIMGKLTQINGSIQTIGNLPSGSKTGNHAMEYFFRTFYQTYRVNGSTFFNEIYPIYADQSLQIYNYVPSDSSKDGLADALYRINAFSTNGSLIDGFKRIKEFLGPNGLNMTFKEYTDFIDALKTRVKYSCNIITLWNEFKKYYGSVAIPTSAPKPSDPVPTVPVIRPKTLIGMIDQINSASRYSRYFSNTEGDFYVYLTILIEHKYSISRILDDVRIGQGYIWFLNNHTKQGFDTINDVPKEPEGFFYYFINGVNSIFGIEPSKKEGLTTPPKKTEPKILDSDNKIIIT